MLPVDPPKVAFTSGVNVAPAVIAGSGLVRYPNVSDTAGSTSSIVNGPFKYENGPARPAAVTVAGDPSSVPDTPENTAPILAVGKSYPLTCRTPYAASYVPSAVTSAGANPPPA